MTWEDICQLHHDLANAQSNTPFSPSKYSIEQQKRDGYNKDKQRVLENMEKVSYL